MSPSLSREIPAPTRVTNLDTDHDTLSEKLDGGSEAWAQISKAEFAWAGLAPCSMIVFRTQEDLPIIVGHFYDAKTMSVRFEEMLTAAREVYKDARTVRVDCFGVSDCKGQLIDKQNRSEEAQATRTFIEKRLNETGFNRVFAHWPDTGNVQDVMVDGEKKTIKYSEYHPRSNY